MITLIVVLSLILIIILIIYIAYRRITRKVKSVMRDLYGTSNLRDADRMLKQEMAATPKSVSAMTSLLLPKITKDFPDFSFPEMRDRANNVLTSYLMAVDNNNPSVLKEGTEDLKAKLKNQLDMLHSQDYSEHFEDIAIHRNEIYRYQKLSGRCIITFQAAVQYLHYIIDGSGKVVGGDKDTIFQTKYNIDLVYLQDRNIVNQTMDSGLGLNCPNCGAPIKGLGEKFCEYCGTAVIEFNIKTWSFNNIQET